MLASLAQRPVGPHHACSRTAILASAVTVRSTQQSAKRTPAQTPIISYSISKDAVTVEDLATLFQAVAPSPPRRSSSSSSSSSRSSVAQGLLQYWTGAPDEAFQQQLKRLLRHSIAVAAAFSRDPHIWTPDQDIYQQQQHQQHQQGAASIDQQLQWQMLLDTSDSSMADSALTSSSSSSSSSSGGNQYGMSFLSPGSQLAYTSSTAAFPAADADAASSFMPFGTNGTSTTSTNSSSSSSSSSSSPWGWRWERPRKRLVAFARAAGDKALVATVHDVLVHPRVQGVGIGTSLLMKLTSQLQAQDVWEVGTLTSSDLEPFFTASGFQPDKEQSTPMVLPRGAAGRFMQGRGVASQQLLTNFELQQLLIEKLEQ